MGTSNSERIHDVHTLRTPTPAIAVLLPQCRVTTRVAAITPRCLATISRRCPASASSTASPPAPTSCTTVGNMRPNFWLLVSCGGASQERHGGRRGFIPSRVLALAGRFDRPPGLGLTRRKLLEPLRIGKQASAGQELSWMI